MIYKFHFEKTSADVYRLTCRCCGELVWEFDENKDGVILNPNARANKFAEAHSNECKKTK